MENLKLNATELRVYDICKKNRMSLPQQVMQLTDVRKGSFLHSIASMSITANGYYDCEYKNLTTIILP